MKNSLKVGLGFGVTSGVITTLGLMVGLHSGTHSTLAIIGGVLTIAIADAFSDSLGVHVSREFENQTSKKEIWESTVTTFISKFVIALLFIFPILLFNLCFAVWVSIFMGLSLLAIFSYIIAKEKKVKPLPVIFEHVGIATVVIIISQIVGTVISNNFI